MPAENGQISRSTTVRAAQGDGSRPRRPPSCRNAGKAQKFTTVRGSSGESGLKAGSQ